MAQHIVDRPTVTWGGQTIFGGSAGVTLSPAACVINDTSDEKDTTVWTGSTIASRKKITGLRTWTAQLTGHASTPTMGSTGLVTASGFTTTYAKAWEMTISCEPSETTYFNSPTYRSFIPGLLSASGTFDSDLDGAAAAVFNPASATGTFRLADTATDHTIAATIFQLTANANYTIGQVATSNFAFVTSGDLTVAGSGGFSPILGTGTLAAPSVASLVITGTTSRTYTGSAFWTSVRIRVVPDEPIAVDMTFQGSGTLTLA